MTQLGEQQFCRYAWEKRGLIRKSREGHFDKSPILRRDSNLQRSRCWRNPDLVWGTFQLPLWQICVGLENHSAKLQIRDFILTRAPDCQTHAQITWLAWTRSWAAWWSRGWPPWTSPSPGWRSASPRWRRGQTSSTRLRDENIFLELVTSMIHIFICST